MATFGGEMTFTLSNTRKMKMRGNYTREGSRFNNTIHNNQDGSISKEVGLKPYRLTCEFEHIPGTNYDALLLENDLDVTVVKRNSKRRDLYTKGTFEGTPTVNEVDGVVTGIMFVSEKFREIVR